ncbi:alpha/beta hydrolase [Actinoalloteichus caeruleus]|uniref:Alpha/beta hydrolase fold n=1 Tax=Actinoalloteichus caeruleus DSM 43889 TaxID=1120930 RepID=A0ABT1JIK0_ACTCY|nr:alpha/beta hydrolase [Actinoalloteichus caeruleus]MCP2332345.1 alpha/beta hydrolase fold [Actinoalloteichus caeruleus DSM 43889]
MTRHPHHERRDGAPSRGLRRHATPPALALAGLFTALLPAAAAADPTTGPEPEPVAWSSCATEHTPPDLECATLAVPLDWAAPDAGTIDLALNRLPAREEDERVGALLVNPGGPGGSGVQTVQYGGMGLGMPEFLPLREHFDLVGFDPRGVGESTPATCARSPHDHTVSHQPASLPEYVQLLRHNREVGLGCRAESGRLVDHMDTGSVARDVDAIRAALGEEQISWLGLSYGTEIGLLYAELYPERVRAMVLDGAVDHSLDPFTAARDEAVATEAALGRFADWCAGSSDCVLRHREVVEEVRRLLDTAEESGVWNSDAGRSATATEVTAGIYGYLNLRDMWPALAEAVAEALDPEGPDAASLVSATMFVSPGYPAYRIVGCHDFTAGTPTYAAMREQRRALRELAPVMWRYTEFSDFASGCAGWPVEPANPPREHQVSGTPTVLVATSAHDPATPAHWAEALAAQFEDARLLTFDGDGHTAALNSGCAREHEARYLIDLEPPPEGLVCRD